jgi:hypothetical protein
LFNKTIRLLKVEQTTKNFLLLSKMTFHRPPEKVRFTLVYESIL